MAARYLPDIKYCCERSVSVSEVENLNLIKILKFLELIKVVGGKNVEKLIETKVVGGKNIEKLKIPPRCVSGAVVKFKPNVLANLLFINFIPRITMNW